MKERTASVTSITVKELKAALGADHPMVSGLAKFADDRVVIVEADKLAEAKAGKNPPTPPVPPN